jgi:hypothetical protein
MKHSADSGFFATEAMPLFLDLLLVFSRRSLAMSRSFFRLHRFRFLSTSPEASASALASHLTPAVSLSSLAEDS